MRLGVIRGLCVLAVRGTLLVVWPSGAASSQVPPPLPLACRDPALYRAGSDMAEAGSSAVLPSRTAALGMVEELSRLHGLAVRERLAPSEVRAELGRILSKARRLDSTGAKGGLAYLVVNGDAMLAPDFYLEDLSWLYFVSFGDAAPVIHILESWHRPEARLRALRAIRALDGEAQRRTVVGWACEAAWLLVAYHTAGALSAIDPLYEPAIDARLLLPHAMRLLGPEVRSEFLQVADRLYPPPHNGREALMGYCAPDWEWTP